MRTSLLLVVTLFDVTAMLACASSRPAIASSKDATSTATDRDRGDAAPPLPKREDKPEPAATEVAADAGPAPPAVKIVTIGMHVAGGPFDEPTKEPFKKAVEPHFDEAARCWQVHVPHPPKQMDVGVDLLIEPSGGHPKVTNPRSTLAKSAEVQGFVPCVVSVFEGVEFPKLVERGRTGVSYSLRFTIP